MVHIFSASTREAEAGEFKAILLYIVSSKSVRDTYGDPLLKTKPSKETNKKLQTKPTYTHVHTH